MVKVCLAKWLWKTFTNVLGMRFSLQTREIIADSIESVTCAQHHDANISIPGCDKNMPGVVMAAARHNRPFLMIYGTSKEESFSSNNIHELLILTYESDEKTPKLFCAMVLKTLLEMRRSLTKSRRNH